MILSYVYTILNFYLYLTFFIVLFFITRLSYILYRIHFGPKCSIKNSNSVKTMIILGSG